MTITIFSIDSTFKTIRATVEATWGWDDEFQAARFRSHWTPTNRQIIIVDQIEIGTITLEEHSDTLFLALIEIQPDYQGRGIGAALVREVVTDAHRRGLAVELNVLKANPRAKQLYERLGFRVAEEEREERYVMVSPAPRSSKS